MVAIRPATAEEQSTVMAIIDGAALRTSLTRIERAIAEDAVLVATPADADRVLGALALDGQEVLNIAVRPRRRGQGIGRALIEAATERRGRLVVECNADLRPFYESVGFDVRESDPDDPASTRLRGILEQ
jgi:GNAT superfamily N-acetyltransferase